MVNAEAAIQKLNEYVERGKTNAVAVVNQVMTEIPKDQVVPVERLYFGAEDDRLRMRFTNQTDGLTLHSNALRQVAERTSIPTAYAEDLNQTPWGRALLAVNLNENLSHRLAQDDRFLVRSLQSEARGFLSSRFRRLDSRPIVDALLGVANQHGGVVASGFAGDVKVSLRIVMPEVRETFPGSGDFVVVGLDFSNSNYGAGALNLSSFLLRLVCLNGAMVAADYRKVHLGARLDESVEYSERTYALDTEATVSAVTDMGRYLLGPARVEQVVDSIRAAAKTEIDPTRALASIRKRLTKAESEAISAKYNSADIVDLPAGQTAWRFSNAVSWLARETEDGARRLDLEAMAGEFVPVAA